MNCPKCGGELRESEKYPGHGLCDRCRKKYKLPNEDDYEESTELNEEIAEPTAVPKKKKGGRLKWVIIAVVAIAILGTALGGNDNTENPKNAEAKYTDIDTDGYIEIARTAIKDKYPYSVFKLGRDNYTVVEATESNPRAKIKGMVTKESDGEYEVFEIVIEFSSESADSYNIDTLTIGNESIE